MSRDRAPLLVEVDPSCWYVLAEESAVGPWRTSAPGVTWLQRRMPGRDPIVVAYRPGFLEDNPQYAVAVRDARRP